METSPFAWMRIGHWTDERAKTGCTVIAFDAPVVASGEVRGGAPASREFALLEPTKLVESIHAVCLSGGSAFGLAASDGVTQKLRADQIGFATKHAVVPIVVGLSLYDLGVGDSDAYPDAAAGSAALDAATSEFAVGQIGAGTGATVGKWRGAAHTRPGGLGFASVSRDDVTVCALIAVNAVGDIDTSGTVPAAIADGTFEWPDIESPLRENTTIGVIATNAALTKSQCRSVAEAGHDGLARAIVPAHTPADGDALVVVSHPEHEADLATVRTLSAVAVEAAIASTA